VCTPQRYDDTASCAKSRPEPDPDLDVEDLEPPF
jgi:hypothetical protein